MKKVLKIVLIFLIILNLYSIIFNVFAVPGDIWETGKNFLNDGASIDSDHFNTTSVNDSFEEIVGFLWGLGLLIVFIATVVLGIKYMLVNPNEKSRVKQATTPYIIGVVIIFGALTIWRVVIALFEGSMLGN